MKNNLIKALCLLPAIVAVVRCSTLTPQPAPPAVGILPTPTPTPLPTATPKPSPTPAPQPVSSFVLPWGNSAWTQICITDVGNLLGSFNKASDSTRFCPNYNTLSNLQKSEAWCSLIAGVAKYESDYNPNSVYLEPAPLNDESIGLLQLSYGDAFCPASPTAGSLKDPATNLNCGIKIMASLIAQDGVVQNSNSRGAARYWSTLRNGHHVNDIAAIVKASSVCKVASKHKRIKKGKRK